MLVPSLPVNQHELEHVLPAFAHRLVALAKRRVVESSTGCLVSLFPRTVFDNLHGGSQGDLVPQVGKSLDDGPFVPVSVESLLDLHELLEAAIQQSVGEVVTARCLEVELRYGVDHIALFQVGVEEEEEDDVAQVSDVEPDLGGSNLVLEYVTAGLEAGVEVFGPKEHDGRFSALAVSVRKALDILIQEPLYPESRLA